MSWLSKDIKDIKPFTPGIMYYNEEKEKEKDDKKEISKNMGNKRGGIVAYTRDGDVFVVFQNVMTWSFPKGHFDSRRDKTVLDTAIREFREETGYSRKIDPSRLIHTMKICDKHTFYLFEMTKEEAKQIPKKRDYFEVIDSAWVNLNDFDEFRTIHPVNKTISQFNISSFLKLTGLGLSSSLSSPSLSFRPKKSRKSGGKKSIKKSGKKKSGTKKKKSGTKKKKSIKKKSGAKKSKRKLRK